MYKDMSITYTIDAEPTYSGTITFKDVPANIIEAVKKLLDGGGLMTEKKETPPSGRDRLSTAEELRRMRIRSGLTVRQVANWCGVTTTTVHRWEKGEREPRKECREALRRLYGVQLHCFEEGYGK